MAKQKPTPNAAYRNNFYSFSDFEIALQEVRDVRDKYKEYKHTMTILDVQDYRDNLAIVSSQLSDMGADLYSDRVSTESIYRGEYLNRLEYWENYYRTNDRPLVKGEVQTKGKWTDIENRSRYSAEKDCLELRREMDKAKAIHTLAYNLYGLTIPKLLDAMSSRIGILIRQLPLGVTSDSEPLSEGSAPRMSRYSKEDDGFGKWDIGREMDTLNDDFEELNTDLKEEL